MGKEIERKFLIKDVEKLHYILKINNALVKSIKQGYISFDPQVRVRVVDCKDHRYNYITTKAYLTIKSKGLLERNEFEYKVPVKDAEELLKTAKGKIIEKTRYTFPHNKLYWEVDWFKTGAKPAEFSDLTGDLPPEDTGFWMAEIELPSAEHEIELPDWLGKEVTFDPRYQNINMAQNG